MAYEGGKATRGYERRRREKDGQAIANRHGRMCGRMFRRRGGQGNQGVQMCQHNEHREKDGGGIEGSSRARTADNITLNTYASATSSKSAGFNTA